MRLTAFSDYALRVLMYAAARDGRLITIDETAGVYGISRAHLMKVVNALAHEGFIETVRLGDVLRATEPDFALVECFSSGNQCLISPRCRLRGALNEALAAFIGTLDRYTLADLLLNPRDFGIKPAA